jgi:hypothetical protein
MQARENRGLTARARGACLLALALAIAGIAPLLAPEPVAWAQYGGVTPGLPYDQSRRVARRTARRTSRRQAAAQEEYYQQAPPQPYPQQPQQPYPQQQPNYYPPPQ